MESRLLGAIRTSAILVTVLSFTQGVAQADVVPGETNTTKTMFDAVTGQTDFSWEEDSHYAITGTEVLVKSAEIGGGTLYEFAIPNFWDPLPKKIIEIEMEGANAGASEFELPSVLDIIGADSDFDKGGPAVPVDGLFVDGRKSPTLVTEVWEMFPNPDFEIVKIYAPVEFELQSISIGTQSLVPVPAAVWLFGSGLLGLIGISRRK